jgi:hypothetical protein
MTIPFDREGQLWEFETYGGRCTFLVASSHFDDSGRLFHEGYMTHELTSRIITIREYWIGGNNSWDSSPNFRRIA